MAKKEVKSKASSNTIDLLLENTIALQKTLTSLASDLKTLNKKVSELYDLFEAASASFKETGAMTEGAGGVPQELLDKINALVEQNRTIARGLLLLEKALREREVKETRRTGILRSIKYKKKPEAYEESEETGIEGTEETGEAETSEEYKPQPLPEFSF